MEKFRMSGWMKDFLKPFNILTLILALIGIKQYIKIPSMNINIDNTTIQPIVILGFAILLIWNNISLRRKMKTENLSDQIESIKRNIDSLKTDVSSSETRANTYASDLFKQSNTRTDNSVNGLRSELKDEFYFIRLKSRIMGRVPGGLDWSYSHYPGEVSSSNQYTDEEKVELKNHTWKFNK